VQKAKRLPTANGTRRANCNRRSKKPSNEAADSTGCAGVKLRQLEALCRRSAEGKGMKAVELYAQVSIPVTRVALKALRGKRWLGHAVCPMGRQIGVGGWHSNRVVLIIKTQAFRPHADDCQRFYPSASNPNRAIWRRQNAQSSPRIMARSTDLRPSRALGQGERLLGLRRTKARL
jgi:hypothetical protein